MASRTRLFIGTVSVFGLAALVLYFWLRNDSSGAVQGGPRLEVERPPVLEAESESSRVGQVRAGEAALAPPEAASQRDDSHEALRREGLRREWKLPKPSELATDDLLGSKGVLLDRALHSELQERMREPVIKLQSIGWSRVSTLERICEEQIKAGLATEVATPSAAPEDGKEHILRGTSTAGGAHVFWCVSIGPGDDPALDALDLELAQTWCSAVQDLRSWFDAHRR